MHARIIRTTGIEHLDAGLQVLQERALPIVRRQPGYVSLSCSVDPETAAGVVVTMWDDAAHLAASDLAMGSARSEVVEALGAATVAMHTYEVAVGHETARHGIAPGGWVRAVRLLADPASVDAALHRFCRDTLPEVEAESGFRGAFVFVDRASGEVVVSTAWDSRADLDAGEEAARRRVDAVVAGGARLVDVAHRQLMLVDEPLVSR